MSQQQQPNYNDSRYPQPSGQYQGQIPQYGHQAYANGAQQYPHVGYYHHGYPAPQYGIKPSPEMYNSGPASTVQGSSNHQHGEPAVEIQWIPHITSDSELVDKWFTELNKDGRGIVGGLEIATFLKRSNLPKESLRTIWSLIDNKNLGYVNKSQFNNIIRLVSISCSPIYMGSPPSLERLQKTLYDKIPLPAALNEVPESEKHIATAAALTPPAEVAPVPEPAHPTSIATHSGGPNPSYSGYPPSYPHPGPYNTMHHMQHHHHTRMPLQTAGLVAGSPAVDDEEFSDFASATASDDAGSQQAASAQTTGSMPASTSMATNRLDAALDEFNGPQWKPLEGDQAKIDKWFADLDAAGTGMVGGLAIAMFLKRSNLPKESLRTIWSLVDSRNAGQVSKQQFTNIIRLVSISCSPIYMGAPPSMERFEKTIRDEICLPYALVHHQEDTRETMTVEHAPVHSVGTTSSSTEHDDEMGEFSSAVSGELSAAPPLEKTISLSTNKLSVFDELVENDLKAVDEEWEDFADSKPSEQPLEKSIVAPESNTDVQHSEPAKRSIQATSDADIPVMEDVDEDDDFGSFDQCDAISSTVPTITVSAGTEESSESILPTTESNIIPVEVDKPTPEAATDVDPFGELDLMADAPLSGAAPPLNETKEDEDEFGSFDEADKEDKTPIQSDGAALAADVGDLEVIPVVLTDIVPGAANDVDPFESLDRVDDTPIRELSSVPMGQADDVEEDVFGSFDEGDDAAVVSSNSILPSENTQASAPVVGVPSKGAEQVVEVEVQGTTVAAAVVVSGVATDFDPFGSLDRTEDVPLGGLTLEPEQSQSDELDEFGSFDEGDASGKVVAHPGAVEIEQNQTIVNDLSLEHQESTKLEINFPSVSESKDQIHATASASAVNEEDEDFGDFGDFETHSPLPASTSVLQQQQTSNVSLCELNQPSVSATMSQSISEVSLFDSPEDDMFMQDAFASHKTDSTAAPAEVDLLDFLSDPTPTPASTTIPVEAEPVVASSSNTSTKLGIAQPFEANFGDCYDTNTPLGHSPVPPAPENAFPTIHSNAMLNDFFSQSDLSDTTASLPPPALSSSTELPNSTQQEPQEAIVTQSKNSINLEDLVTRKPLSLNTLEELTTILINKNLYEDAYNCHQQYKLIKNIYELTKKKELAIQEDDLELAMILKKEIIIIQQKLQSIDQEYLWENAANSNRKGESLLEIMDLLENINENIAKKYKLKFSKHITMNNLSIEDICKYNILAKRYSYMILLTNTTNFELPKQWLLVLQIVVKKVKEGNEIIMKFKSLSKADQTSLISHLQMSEYALGLVAVSEVGMWVSASCIEAMVHEDIALEVYTVCQELLGEVDRLWGMGSRFKEVPLDGLTLEAARLAENANVQYCSFTVRPLSYEIYKRDGDKMKAERVKLFDNPLALTDSHFMEPVIKLWLHDISKTLPQCGAAVR